MFILKRFKKLIITKRGKKMIGAIAKLKIKDGERDNFIEAMGNLVKSSS